MNEPRRRPTRNLLVAGVALALAILVTAGVKSWNDLLETRTREQQLEERIAEAQRRIESLADHVQRLQDDPVALERAARVELGFVRPEDIVVVLPTARVAGPRPAAEPAVRAGGPEIPTGQADGPSGLPESSRPSGPVR